MADAKMEHSKTPASSSTGRACRASCSRPTLWSLSACATRWCVRLPPFLSLGSSSRPASPLSPFATRPQQIDTSAPPDELCPRLARALQNVTILQKGNADIISNGLPIARELRPDHAEGEILKNEVQGGLKRCGGQGDILSGSVGVLLAWGSEWVKGTYE